MIGKEFENKIVGVRFPPEDVALMQQISETRGENVSDFVRLSVRKEFARLDYLDDEKKQALEV